MSFTFTPVVADAPILADSFQDAFDKLQTYINGGVAVGDVVGPFQKHHIMKGSFQPLPNTFNFVSGVCGSQVFTTVEEKLSWLAGATTQPVNGNNVRRYYPSTSISFYVETECTTLFQFFACPLMYNFGLSTTTANEREGTLNVSIDGITYLDTKVFTHEEWYATSTNLRQREFFTGFQMMKLSKGWHHISLEGYTNGNDIFLINWGFTLEAWHDSNVLTSSSVNQ